MNTKPTIYQPSAAKVIAALKSVGFESVRSNFGAFGFQTYQFRRRYPGQIRGHMRSESVGPVRVWHFEVPFVENRLLREQLTLDLMQLALEDMGMRVNRLDHILEIV